MKKNTERKSVAVLIVLPLLILMACGEVKNKSDQEINSFSTNGHTVYHLRTGSVSKEQRAVFTASIDGVVQCFKLNGKLIWQAGTDGGFPFDLCVADIDNDGLDEVLVASGNGSLYAFDNNGKSLWTFSKEPPLYQVSVARQKDGSAIVLAGGVEQILYAISPKGEVVKKLKTQHCIRHIRTGNILNDANDYVALATTSTGLNGNLTLMLINPADLNVIWAKDNLGNYGFNMRKRFCSMLVTDVNKDGYDEIMLTGGNGPHDGRLYCYDHQGERVFIIVDEKIPRVAYRMNLLRHVKLPGDEFILGHYGNILIVYELDGTCREVLKGHYSFTDSYFDPDLKTLFMGSSVSGGDEVISLRLDQPGWQKEFETVVSSGKIAEIEKNIETLNRQIKEFTPPDYQPAPVDINIIAQEPVNNHFHHLSFTKNITLTQKIENPDELWCLETDKRWKYDLSADELVDIVAKNEAEGQNIIIWAAHGSAVFFPLSTFKRLLEAAPKHLIGFVFAEMEGTDRHMQDVVAKLLLPIAELCKEHKKVIVFRNKNIFWNGSCYLPFWREVLLNKRYSDVFIPGLEETNCRTQELSLAGRIGLWQTGSFDHWACRTVTDNANFNRMFEWGGQQVITHHLRNLVSSASMGSDLFFSDIWGGSDTDSLFEQLIPFYEMVEKGIIHIPQKNELLSLSDFALGMKSPPSATYIEHGRNGHSYSFPETEKTEMVFNRLDTYWAGALIDSFDYSYYAFNAKRRFLNFLPETPFGMTAIIPSETQKNETFKNIILTDGEYFYDEKGEQRTAKNYQAVVEAALAESASRMPVVVKGEAHWSVVKLDAEHIRVTLIDPGYLDPAERKCEIILQHIQAISCIDILSGEDLPVKGGYISLTVPAGIFRIVDVTLRN